MTMGSILFGGGSGFIYGRMPLFGMLMNIISGTKYLILITDHGCFILNEDLKLESLQSRKLTEVN
jgi:hypothetical protein